MQILEIRAMPASDDILAGSNWRFDTYHVGAPIREMPHAGWARAREREIEHYDACQRKTRVGVVVVFGHCRYILWSVVNSFHFIRLWRPKSSPLGPIFHVRL